MNLALMTLNGIALLAVAASIAVGRLYGHAGEWSGADFIELLFAAPCIVALLGLRNAASRSTKVLAVRINGLWILAFVALGLFASTGIGGMVGLLFVIVPVLLLLWANRFVLRRQLRGG